MSREYTRDEAQAMFIENAKEIARFWSKVDKTSVEEQILGAIFGIFVIFDGESADLPGFTVTPHPHEDDKAYHQGRNENWFPDNVNIAGDLHEQFVKEREGEGERKEEDVHIKLVDPIITRLEGLECSIGKLEAWQQATIEIICKSKDNKECES